MADTPSCLEGDILVATVPSGRLRYIVKVRILPLQLKNKKTMRIEFQIKAPDFQKMREEMEEEHGEGYEEALDLNKILSGEQPMKKIPITYKRWALELGDISHFGEEDDEHVEVRTSMGAFSIRIDYDVFKQIYTTATNMGIKTMSDFKLSR